MQRSRRVQAPGRYIQSPDPSSPLTASPSPRFLRSTYIAYRALGGHAVHEYHETKPGDSCGAFAVNMTVSTSALGVSRGRRAWGQIIPYVDTNVILHLFVSAVPLPTRPLFLSAVQLRPF